jgi:alkanesulfonate monooxygenase
MGVGSTHAPITIYSTCPQSKDVARADYTGHVADVARWSEEAGCRGILVYTDNSIADPWVVAQHVIASTRALRPLVAVQPVYMHPYTAAKKIASLALLHGRAVDVNLVAGGFRNDLRALGDETPHDHRYDRVIEYATILRRLLDGEGAVSLDGRYYRVSNLRLTPPVPEELRPRLLISGSSPAGRDAARSLDAVAIRYPQPPHEEDENELRANGLKHGIRVGIIARENASEAWEVARARFPENRQGQIAHALAMSITDSRWHKQLSGLPNGGESALDPYWLEPFKSYGTFCPYLVGAYGRVADEVGRYLALGVRTIITDIPHERDDLRHTRRVVDQALAGLAA